MGSEVPPGVLTWSGIAPFSGTMEVEETEVESMTV